MNDPREPATNAYVLKVNTGPGMTDPLAEKCEEAGIRVLSRGTESIYPRIAASTPRKAWDRLLNTLFAHHGTTFGFSYGLATRISEEQPEKEAG